MTGVETHNGPACNIDDEPLFDEELLAVMQASRYCHQTGVYTDKEDRMLCDAWLHIGTNPISGA
jgi:hypothetical protein